MQPFLGPDFLLPNEPARRLYHEVAADLPIIDYHNHLPPQEIAENRTWDNIGELWLGHDHYKWRLMRWAGIEEERITGKAGWRTKFDAFAETMPQCIGNPMYHWSHLELWRYFGLEGTVFSPATADECWEAANAQLSRPAFSARGLLERMKVELVGTTDDPTDTLEHHEAMLDAGLPFKVVPSFRPDRAIKIEAEGFATYVEKLATVSGTPVRRFDDLVGALNNRLTRFVALGCRASDHGLEVLRAGQYATAARLDAILRKRLDGGTLDEDEIADFQTALLVELGRAYAKHDLVMQLHIGPLRNTRTRLFDALGADSGGDSMNDLAVAGALNAFLDRLDRTDELPRTILYCLDPTKNAMIAATAGNFQDGSTAGKVQAGAAWWFNDQLDGMEHQLTQLAQMGLLSRFVGMLTDSRSFLSFPRHEYYRRLVCRMVGGWMEEGAMPPDHDLAAGIIEDICYRNARRWFL